MKKYLLISFLLLMVMRVQAQESYQIPQQVKDLYAYDGKWEGVITLTVNGQTETGTVYHDWSKIADGWGMLIDEKGEVPNMGPPYIGHNIFGYDIGEGMYHLYTIDNSANMHDHKGTIDGNVITLEQNGLTPKKIKANEKIVMTFLNENEYTVYVIGYVDGETAYEVNMDMKKVK
jgi:Protein of unknown function (DUF1579)